jgi:cell cycle related kinase
MLSDLSEIIKTVRLNEAQIKAYLLMILKGVQYCHQNSILHRDIKPANLLIATNRVLKLADFGLSRCHTGRPLSHQVATRWYRAPELLYGARQYDEGVDLWAVGCVFGEMLNRSPIFPGQNDIDQLYQVLSVLGSPNPETWPECTNLPDYDKIGFPEMKGVDIGEVCPDASPQAVELLRKFLVYRSQVRIRASEALLDSYFFHVPLPSHHLELPLPQKRQREQFDVDKPLDLSLFTPIKAT